MFSFKKVGIVLLVVLAFEVVPNKGQNLTVVHDACKARIGNPQRNTASEVAGRKATHYASENVGRRLMASDSSAGCIWYEEAEACESNFSVPAELFSNSTNKFARYLSNIFTCLSATNRDSCVEKGRCRWDTSSEACGFDFYTTGYERSPCAKAAPALAQEYSTNIACQKRETSRACSRGNNCTWLEDDEFCIADIFSVYFGLESFDKFYEDFSEAFDAKSDAAVDDFTFRYITNGPPSSWNVVLGWEVPKSTCPEDSTTTECNYVEAFLENSLPATFYCLFSYNDSFSCAADSLCAYDYEESSCFASDEVTDFANLNAIATLLDRVEAEVDRDVLTATISCPTIVDESDCKEHCRWDVQYEICKTNMTFVRSRIAEAGRDSWRGRRDPICRLVAFVEDTNCTNIDSPQKCEATTHCEWKLTQTCDLSNEEYIQLALEKADDVDAPIESLWSDCLEYTRKRACLAAEA